MSGLQVRPQLPEDDDAVVALWNAIGTGTGPLMVERYRAMCAIGGAHARSLRWVAVENGAISGGLSLEEVVWLANPGVYFVQLAVLPDRRRRGIGNHLTETMHRVAGEIGADRLIVRVAEGDESAERFAGVHGFTPTGDIDRRSRLDLQRFKDVGGDHLLQRLHDRGIHLKPLSNFSSDESFLVQLYDLTESTAVDIPSSEPSGREPFETWRIRYLDGPGLSPESTWVAAVGEIPIGVAYLLRYSEEAGGNIYTGVDPSYRGLGVARALKTRQIGWAQAHGIRYLYTSNDAANAPILAINMALGYEFLAARTEWGKWLRDGK